MRDIVWRYETVDGSVNFSHDGSDAARGVAVTVTVDGQASVARFSKIEPSSEVTVPSPRYAELVRKSRAEDEEFEREVAASRRRRESPQPGRFSLPVAEAMPLPSIPRKVEMAAVIAWTYPSGAQDRQELRWSESL